MRTEQRNKTNRIVPWPQLSIVQARPVYFLRPEVFFQNHDLVLLFFNYMIYLQCDSDLYLYHLQHIIEFLNYISNIILYRQVTLFVFLCLSSAGEEICGKIY